MPGALPITYHLTRRQTLAAALRFGLIASILSIPLVVVMMLSSVDTWQALLTPVGLGAAVTVVALPFIRRGGIIADEVGIRPRNRASRRQQAPWHLITDVRAERRAARTVPVVYLTSGRMWRLRVPYNGVLLGADPRFDEKLCVIRNMWDTYRLWQQPPGVVDEDYSNTSADG